MPAQNNRTTWRGDSKIPWDDPAFSRRMLAEHLSQDHDMASRGTRWIDQQVEWIHNRLLHRQLSRILDLGCGPGLYAHRLTVRGHPCHAIDFGPASIEYARQHNPDESLCTFILGDLRQVPFGGPYDLAMILFGEFNTFSPREVLDILHKVRASLRPSGQLIIETQTPEAVQLAGRAAASDQLCQSGLFSDQPYRCRTENRWLPDEQVTVQTFSVTETAGSEVRTYRSTTRAWPDHDLIDLLRNAGFREAAPCESWPCNTDALRLWLARG